MYSHGPPHMVKQKQDDQLEHTYSSSVRIRDVALKTCQRRWIIGRSRERWSGISVLAARHDDDMYIYIYIYSPDGDTENFDIVTGVLQGDTLAPYLFIICLDYMLRTSIDNIKEKGFKLTKKRSRRYSTKTITDADDIALLANAPVQAETLLHSLERAAAGIGLHINAHKTDYMCFNQTGDVCTLNGSSLKLVDKFTYLGSSVSSTETDINTRLAKAWIAIYRLSVMWKSDLTDKIKRSFFQAAIVSILLYGCTI